MSVTIPATGAVRTINVTAQTISREVIRREAIRRGGSITVTRAAGRAIAGRVAGRVLGTAIPVAGTAFLLYDVWRYRQSVLQNQLDVIGGETETVQGTNPDGTFGVAGTRYEIEHFEPEPQGGGSLGVSGYLIGPISVAIYEFANERQNWEFSGFDSEGNPLQIWGQNGTSATSWTPPQPRKQYSITPDGQNTPIFKGNLTNTEAPPAGEITIAPVPVPIENKPKLPSAQGGFECEEFKECLDEYYSEANNNWNLLPLIWDLLQDLFALLNSQEQETVPYNNPCTGEEIGSVTYQGSYPKVTFEITRGILNVLNDTLQYLCCEGVPIPDEWITQRPQTSRVLCVVFRELPGNPSVRGYQRSISVPFASGVLPQSLPAYTNGKWRTQCYFAGGGDIKIFTSTKASGLALMNELLTYTSGAPTYFIEQTETFGVVSNLYNREFVSSHYFSQGRKTFPEADESYYVNPPGGGGINPPP